MINNFFVGTKSSIEVNDRKNLISFIKEYEKYKKNYAQNIKFYQTSENLSISEINADQNKT